METETTVPVETEETKAEKRVRKRKKKLHQAIKTQMEFYFSDSNLMKDKFLGKVLSENEDGWVPLDVFFHFNKIRALNCSIKDICKAIKKSELLETSSDEKLVRRLTPVGVKENVDECTLYVEHLPAEVDHDWLKNMFSPFGAIDYISLPRFKQKGTVKGFAFIEFSTPEEAQKACKHFGYHQEDESKNGEEQSESSHRPKRRRGTSESEDSGKKRIRQSNLSESSNKDTNVQPGSAKAEEAVPKESEDDSVMADNGEQPKKKKRSRKKKRKSQEAQEKPLPALRVMPKEEWKRWKNKYLSMQKATMSQIKMSLSGMDPVLLSKEAKDSGLRNVNPTPPMEEDAAITETPKKRKKDQLLQFLEGTVIRLKMKEPISKPAELKTQLRNLGKVAYVEAEEGEKVVYIRCSAAEETQRILADTDLPGKARLLEGEDEKSYWEKLQSDRHKKLSSDIRWKKRTKKVQTKSVKQQNTHITFEN